MGQLGIFVERYTISNSNEMNALMRLSMEARKLGHSSDFLFRPDIYKIPQYDAIFIRALTDPLNSSYVVARTAEMNGIKVLDDSDSIRICCDKVNMYRHLMNKKVPIPETIIIERNEISADLAGSVIKQLRTPVVLKAPNSSFSLYVEKVDTVEEFLSVAKRFFRRADRIVAQKFLKSSFDWRVGMLGGEPLYVCRYMIPRNRWKILTHTSEGGVIEGKVKGVAIGKAPLGLLETATNAANAVGNGLYGVDLKQIGDDFVVIEVNDNPTIAAGDEDQASDNLYEKLIKFLFNG